LNQHSTRSLSHAILRTVAYGDLFDFPMTAAEILRYLEAIPASADEVRHAAERMSPGQLQHAGRYFVLPGRAQLAEIRDRRAVVATRLWPDAERCAYSLGRLPFVRMVAVTGALAMDNVDDGADLDFLIVTEPARVWLCRTVIIQLVRLYKLRGVVICPNWILSREAIRLERRDLFSARELAQMVPLVGPEVYRQMIEANDWMRELLPNAVGPPRTNQPVTVGASPVTRLGEVVLRSAVGDPLERWVQRRKTREIGRLSPGNPEVVLDHRQCKGHVDGHGRRIAEAYRERLRSLSLDP
jgi:hypothetical protein